MKYSLKKVMVLDTVPVALQYKLSYLIIFKCLIALMGCDRSTGFKNNYCNNKRNGLKKLNPVFSGVAHRRMLTQRKPTIYSTSEL